MEFRFWRRARGDSPPRDVFDALSEELQFRIIRMLKLIENNGFAKSINEYFKQIRYQREKVYQITEGRWRIVFIMVAGDGVIYDIFMKKSPSDEQAHYRWVAQRINKL